MMPESIKEHWLDKTDVAVLKGLFRFRYLTIDLISVINPELSYSAWTKRLRKLLASGYIDRPPQQLWTFRKHEKAIYALDQKGADYLTDHCDFSFPQRVRWHEKNRRYRGQDPFSHALSTAEFMIQLEQNLKQSGVTLSHQDELFGVDYVTGISWETRITTEHETITPKLKPDGIFSLSIPGRRYPMNFFLEIDRGTMPIRSQNFNRTSILKKFLSYQDTHLRELAKDEFGFRNFRVIMVTTSSERADNMKKLWDEITPELPNLCLFSSHGDLEDLRSQMLK